jgi:hypothetical protein
VDLSSLAQFVRQPYQMRLVYVYRCRVFISYRNINRFPFPVLPIRSTVRSDLPLAELHCQGTLSHSGAVSLTLLCSYYYQDLHSNTVQSISRPIFCPCMTPSYHVLSKSAVSAICLSPVHFRRCQPRRVSCYALFKGWLLLSQPPRCFRLTTFFNRLH